MHVIFALGAILMALAVGAGAFGAHALKATLDVYGKEIYEKAALYHFIHALGILVVGVIGAQGVIPQSTAWRIALALTIGVLLFSGSLYALAITKIRILGAVTPIGGTLFIIAWVWLAIAALRN